MAIEVIPCHPFVGAEIRGVDVSQTLSDRVIEEIHAAIDRHAVVFFRGQKLNDDAQVAFAGRFGALEKYTVALRADAGLRLSRPEMADVSNVDGKTGKPEERNARHRLLNMSARFWHADSSFRIPVGALSMLYSHSIPPQGGETEFADVRAAYDELPMERKAEINSLVVEHSMVQGYEKLLGFTDFEQGESLALPPVRQWLVRSHSRSGRKALYLGWSAMRILDMPTPEGRVLLAELTEYATQPRFVYQHKWKIGDLLIWDNRSVLHRVRRYDERHLRDMRRVTTSDTVFTEAAAQ